MTYRPYNAIVSGSVGDQRSNNTGVTIDKGTPVRINTSGTLDFIDVSVTAEILNIAGVAKNDILSATSGEFVSGGKVEDITTSASLGDVLYIDKAGALTNVKPSLGVAGFVAGDYSVRVGVVAKNENNGSLKDLIVSLNIIERITEAYDEEIEIVASGAGAGQLNGPIAATTPITLPNSQTYTGDELKVSLDGQLQTPGRDFVFDSSTTIYFNQEVEVGVRVRFMIDEVPQG